MPKNKKIRSPQPAVLSRLADIPPADRPQTRILDIPAGNGVLMIPLLAAGFDVTGCDLFPEYARKNLSVFREHGMLEGIRRSCKGTISELCSEKLFGSVEPELPQSLDIVAADMEQRLPFDDASFDIVTCVEGIEHVDAQYRVIGELRRVLKPGGRLFLTTPNMLCIRSRVAYALTGQRTFQTFIDEYTEVQDRSDDGKRMYHGHVFLIDYFQLRYYLHNNSFKIDGLLPFPASTGSRLLSIPALPLMLLTCPWGPFRAYRKLRKLKNSNQTYADVKPPYLEILRHVFSPPALFGSVIALEAKACPFGD